MSSKRIKGGEKNENSGKPWTKEELAEVFKLFIENKELKIHEHNPELDFLAKRINRTIRSIEAQLLMFRNLSKHGDYSYGNMSKLCKLLWLEYLDGMKK